MADITKRELHYTISQPIYYIYIYIYIYNIICYHPEQYVSVVRDFKLEMNDEIARMWMMKFLNSSTDQQDEQDW